MDLRHFVGILWRRKWLIALVTLVATIVVFIGTLFIPPRYAATTTLRIATGVGAQDAQVSWDDIQYSERLMSTLTTLAKSDATRQELQQKFQMSEAPQVEIDIPANTELMHITVSHGNPGEAAAAANALAEILTAQLQMLHPQGGRSSAAIIRDQMVQIEQELREAREDYEQRVIEAHENSEQLQNQWRVIELKERTYATLLDQYERARVADVLRANVVSVVSVATPPTDPSSPNPMLNLALAVLVGLAGGVGLAFLLEYFDTTLYTSQQIEDVTTWSMLAKIPQAPRGHGALAIDDSVQGEAFRRLRTNFLSVGHGEKTFLITSADPSEGKSTISSNLAISIARSGRTVVLVDSDMRLPTVHKLFQLPNVQGLSTVLTGEATVDAVIQQTDMPNLRIITSGPRPSDPAELLGSHAMSELMTQLEQRFDVVLLDAPSLLAVADAAVLAQVVDGVLLVVGRTRARREAVLAAQDELQKVKAHPVGVVVNRAEQERSSHYYTSARQPRI